MYNLYRNTHHACGSHMCIGDQTTSHLKLSLSIDRPHLDAKSKSARQERLSSHGMVTSVTQHSTKGCDNVHISTTGMHASKVYTCVSYLICLPKKPEMLGDRLAKHGSRSSNGGGGNARHSHASCCASVVVRRAAAAAYTRQQMMLAYDSKTLGKFLDKDTPVMMHNKNTPFFLLVYVRLSNWRGSTHQGA